MREPGEPMEFGIFDFYKVFSRAFGEKGNGVGGIEWKQGDVVTARYTPYVVPGMYVAILSKFP